MIREAIPLNTLIARTGTPGARYRIAISDRLSGLSRVLAIAAPVAAYPCQLGPYPRISGANHPCYQGQAGSLTPTSRPTAKRTARAPALPCSA